MFILSLKLLKKLTGTSRRTGGQTGAQDYVLSQADALIKKRLKGAALRFSKKVYKRLFM